MNLLYKIILRIKGYKYLVRDRLYIASRHLSTNNYVIWYIDSSGTINILTEFATKKEFLFMWKVLLKRRKH